ncbi:TPA: FusB/FusC family EF-G-binding protein [Staphylococcus pseudintermedius]
MKKIKAYEYVKVKKRVNELINLYRTNDIKLHATQKDMILNEIAAIFGAQNIDVSFFIRDLDDRRLTKKKAERLYHRLEKYVEAFEIPSLPQIQKIFRKVKKIKTLDEKNIDLKVTSYLGWNDNASNRKYIIYKNHDNRFDGIYGERSPNKVKGFCKVCNQESNVALFLIKTKHNKNDGTYTKKGDYICYDSAKCNQNLDDIHQFYQFIGQLK